ncbi:MAG: TatD family hydrolase [Bradymonadaceae bacterium]
MKIFDAHLRSDTRSDDDLRNLAYFDTERVVTTAHAPRPFETADDLLEYFEFLVEDECRRLEHSGLRAGVALGVLPEARPERLHPEIWEHLPDLLEHPRVVAVGEIGAHADEPAHWELFERQVEMAVEAGLPVVVTPPSRRRINLTYKMMMRAEEVGLEPKSMMMNYLDGRSVEHVLRDGFVAGLAIVGAGVAPERAARLIADAVETVGSAERIVLSSALRAGSSDVLGIPKTLASLEEDQGADEALLRAVARENALEFYG